METNAYYLNREQIESMPAEKKIHHLNDRAIRFNKSLGDQVGMKNLGIHLIEVEPGYLSTETHIHYYEEEAIYVLSGSATLIIDDFETIIGPGDFIGLPAGKAAHNIINQGKEVFKALVVGQRLEQDVADYPEKKIRLYRNSGERNLVDIENITNHKVLK